MLHRADYDHAPVLLWWEKAFVVKKLLLPELLLITEATAGVQAAVASHESDE